MPMLDPDRRSCRYVFVGFGVSFNERAAQVRGTCASADDLRLLLHLEQAGGTWRSSRRLRRGSRLWLASLSVADRVGGLDGLIDCRLRRRARRRRIRFIVSLYPIWLLHTSPVFAVKSITIV